MARPARSTAIPPLLLMALLASSCGGGTEPTDRGSYSGSVTGNASGSPLTGSFSGTASFGVDPDQWSMSMTPRTPRSWRLTFNAFPGGRPAAGTTLPMVSNEFPRPATPHAFVTVNEYFEGGSRHWMSQSGDLSITSSSPTRLAGSFQFTARAYVPMTFPGEITVTGTFDAVCPPNMSC